jgi:hypothetical protein
MMNAKEFENFGDRELAAAIHKWLSGWGAGGWDRAKFGRAVEELDRRINRS